MTIVSDSSQARRRGRGALAATGLAAILTVCFSGATLRGKEGPAGSAGERVSFNQDIRPILSDACFHCHGPDEKARKADLRLDLEKGAIAGPENPDGVIRPGQAKQSEFMARLLSTDPEEVMPPADSQKKLTPEQVEIFRRWIEEGAEWKNHWAFEKIARPEVPAPDTKSNWGRNEIDRFILARMRGEGLSPSPPADPRRLLRRLTLDLTGLPPSPEEIEDFVKNFSEETCAATIDRLMASPAYGEHRARYWLDAARYADTHGLHLDNYREIWPYRDWVIRAFNENEPFDRFTIEQLAGDLLPDATRDQVIATGFNRCNVTTSEGGAIDEEFLVRYAVDRVNTMSTVWLGLTAGCAQCHDHKYDPISMREYYSLFAYFNNTTQPGMDGNAKDSPPVIRVFASDEAKADYDAAARKEAAARNALDSIVAEAKKALSGRENGPALAGTFASLRLPGAVLEKPAANDSETPLELGGAGDFRVDRPFSLAFRYRAPNEEGRSVILDRTDPKNRGRGWRIVLEEQGINVQLIESWPDRVLRTGITRRVKAGGGGHFAVVYDGSGRSHGIRLFVNGELQTSRFVNEWFDTLEKDFRAEAVLRAGGRLGDASLATQVSELELFDRNLSELEIRLLANAGRLPSILKQAPDKRSASDRELFDAAWAISENAACRARLIEWSEADAAASRILSRTPVTLVMDEKGEPAKAHILERGEYDKAREEVASGVPDFLPALPKDAPANRLGLARWLVDPGHPLTARVVVNRAWQEIFGTGLVKTAEDFGAQGEPPSHPELLDWLAAAFIESGWDVKALYRTLLMSETYRQNSAVTPDRLRIDPENRYLSRGPRFRMDAEMLRDQALAASGLLSGRVGGPSVRPWQPPGIWEAVGYTNSNTQTFYQDFGEVEHRRSLYTFWKRTAPPPNLSILDAPDRESCAVRRERTNTPLQALVLMNDPQFVRASRFLAQRVLESEKSNAGRLDRLSLLLRGRPMEKDEREALEASLTVFQNAWASDPKEAAAFLADSVNPRFSLGPQRPAEELAAWSMVASQIMNLDETVNKN